MGIYTHFRVSHVYRSVSMSVILVISLLINSSHYKTPRETYKKYLAAEYAKLSGMIASGKQDNQEKDNPGMAVLQDYFRTMDPALKRVPAERLEKAYRELQGYKNAQAKKGSSPDLNWQEIPSDMAGRVRAIMLDPNDPDNQKAWAGGVTGGLWVNNNIMATDSPWHPVNDFWEHLSISSLAHDPNHKGIYYAGTGEPQTAVTIYRNSSGRGIGIWRSVDSGNTWKLLPSTGDFAYITDLAIRDEDGASAIYAGVVSGRYEGKDHRSRPGAGLYRSVDSGKTWKQVLPLIPGENFTYAPSDIEIASNGRIFVGTGRTLDQKGGAVIFYSDTGKTGTWTKFGKYNKVIRNNTNFGIPGRVVLDASPSNPKVVYALIAAGFYTNPLWVYSYGKYILRSNDGGKNWQETNLPSDYPRGRSWAALAWHSLEIEVDPNRPNTVYAGGVDLHRSQDSGQTWQKISKWRGLYIGEEEYYVHADIHHVNFYPGSSDTFFITTDGGVFVTFNGTAGETVYEHRNHSLNTLQFYTGAITPDKIHNTYLGGLQDNGSLLAHEEGLSSASEVSGGDGAFCFFDKNEPEIFITSTYNNNYYIFSDRGVKNVRGNSGSFQSPVDYDYKDNVLFANGYGLFGGGIKDHLFMVNGIPDNPQPRFIDLNSGIQVPFSHIRYLPYSPPGEPVLYAGTQSGHLYRIEDVRRTPDVKEVGSPDFPAGNISCVAVGSSEDTLLVTFSNYGITSVWFSMDRGVSWTEKEGNLPDMPVRWALFHPRNANKALLATELGVWATEDLRDTSTNWKPVNDSLAHVRVDMLRLRKSDGKLLAATHGRGMFVGKYGKGKPPVIGIDRQDGQAYMRVYPNPTPDQVVVDWQGAGLQEASIVIRELNGRVIKSKTCRGQNTARFSLAGYPGGFYFVQLYSGRKKITRKILLRGK